MASKKLLLLVVVLAVATAILAKPTNTDIQDESENTIPQGDDSEVPLSIDMMPPTPKAEDQPDTETTAETEPSSPSPPTKTEISTPTVQNSPLSTISRIVRDFIQVPIGVIGAVYSWMTNTFSSNKN